MIHFQAVAQLMYNNTVQNAGRRQAQQAVEVQIASGAAAAPPGLLIADRDVSVRNANKRRVVRDSLRNDAGCFLRQCLQLRAGQLADRMLCLLRFPFFLLAKMPVWKSRLNTSVCF